MSDIVRAWKDETYRQGLSVEEQTALPANPAGEIDLTDEELEAVYGAWSADWFNKEEEEGGNRNTNTLTNTNTNTATSSSISSATGGTATASTGPISIIPISL